jgi:hypothetical protein
LVVGAFIVAGIYLFNVWQQRQFRRRVEQVFAREHDDVLLQQTGTSEEVPAARVEPTLHVAPATPVAPPMASTPLRATVKTPSPTLVDPLIDYVVEVNIQTPADGADLHEELLMLAAGWNKPVLVAGYDPSNGEWKPAGTSGDAGFARLRFAVQMSNRAGCVEPSQLTAFRDAVVKWAARNQGDAKCLDVAEAHAMATQLDRFCADVDIAIGINVVTADGNPFSGTKIRALAESAGLKLEPDGLFYARGDHGDARYTLDNHEPMPFVPEQMKTLSTRGITFLLDVPRVDGALRAFDAMLEMAESFASALDGTLVDDNRAELSDDAIAKIRRQLENILAKMEAGQIPAGGTRALRLFT